MKCQSEVIIHSQIRKTRYEVLIGQTDFDGVGDLDVFRILVGEGRVGDTDNDGADLFVFALLVLSHNGHQCTGFRHLLNCQRARKIKHPADAGLILENLFLKVLIACNSDLVGAKRPGDDG